MSPTFTVFICILILTAILFDSKHYDTAILMNVILYEKVAICLSFKIFLKKYFLSVYNHFAVILDHKLKHKGDKSIICYRSNANKTGREAVQIGFVF